MNFIPNCNVRYPPLPAHRNPHGTMYRPLPHQNENPQCSSSTFNQKYQAGLTFQSLGAVIVCLSCYSLAGQCHSQVIAMQSMKMKCSTAVVMIMRGVIVRNLTSWIIRWWRLTVGKILRSDHFLPQIAESPLSHPLQDTFKSTGTLVQRAAHLGTIQSPMNWLYCFFTIPRGSCLIRGSSGCSNVDNSEPRGTKRHYQNNRTSRSPSPLLNTSTSCKPNAESVASRPKRRFQDCCEGLPPIVPSACLVNIQLRSHRPDNLLNGSEWDRVCDLFWIPVLILLRLSYPSIQLSHAIWCKYTSHEQTQDTLRRKLRLREMVHHYIRVNILGH